MEHNFKALTTFRGWSDMRQSFVYGYHCNISGQDYIITDGMTLDAVVVKTLLRGRAQHFTVLEKKEDRIAINHDEMISVVKESIGIYTGRDDKNGTPIFAGLPEDGNIGGDTVNSAESNMNVVFYNGKFMLKRNEFMTHIVGYNIVIEVIGTAYEQHLKEKK